MAVTSAQIRALLNRPRGLLEETINEYITIRTNEVNKKARSKEYLAADSTNAVGDAEKENAIKCLVCLDCLQVLIQSVPTIYPEDKQSAHDIRFAALVKQYRDRANSALALIEGKGSAAFATDSTDTRKPSSTIDSTGVIRNSMRTLE